MRIYRVAASVMVISTILALQGCVPARPDNGWRRCSSGQHFDGRFNRCIPDQQNRYLPNRNHGHDANRDRDHDRNRNWNRDSDRNRDREYDRDRDRDNNAYHYNNYR